MQVSISVESKRGCGYRKPAKDGVGIYLIGDALSEPCGLLPHRLEACPCCGGGIKPSRAWTWITPRLLLQAKPLGCARNTGFAGLGLNPCAGCVVANPPEGKHGLLWIGGGFYDSPEDFTREVARMGISRKLSTVPKNFELGKTWVYLAHRHAIQPAPGYAGSFDPDAAPEQQFHPGIFAVFKPTHVDLVIADEHNVPEKAKRIAEQLGEGNVRIVKVIPANESQTDLFAGAEAQ